ncbi:MAG: hypothetical protein ACM3YM_02825 [Sphingomonadales bacterium]
MDDKENREDPDAAPLDEDAARSFERWNQDNDSPYPILALRAFVAGWTACARRYAEPPGGTERLVRIWRKVGGCVIIEPIERSETQTGPGLWRRVGSPDNRGVKGWHEFIGAPDVVRWELLGPVSDG